MHVAAFGVKSILLSSPGRVLSFADVRVQLSCEEGRQIMAGNMGKRVVKSYKAGIEA